MYILVTKVLQRYYIKKLILQVNILNELINFQKNIKHGIRDGSY